ncbi:MAG: hypothetical protein HY787_07875 [Deltaproteobacteria bacterium]|nr:hypothetical protein [Deltaproteobacteria bacterium]
MAPLNRHATQGRGTTNPVNRVRLMPNSIFKLKRRGREFLLLKTFILVVLCLTFVGILSCNYSGTSSTAGSGGTSGSGTGWRITINVGNDYIPVGATTGIISVVKDASGAPVPKTTMVCFTAINGGFAKGTEVFATICESTTNDLGWSSQTYVGLIAGDDTIQVYSQGFMQTAGIIVYE